MTLVFTKLDIIKIDDSVNIQDDLRALPMNPNEFDIHRIISIMIHIKILIEILINRTHSRIRPDVVPEQYGFVKDAGIRKAKFISGMISERAITMYNDDIRTYVL